MTTHIALVKSNVANKALAAIAEDGDWLDAWVGPAESGKFYGNTVAINTSQRLDANGCQAFTKDIIAAVGAENVV